ncbi:MAG: enoyl-CoA hydratase-related protein, partial [Nannocystaceae bacterium]
LQRAVGEYLAAELMYGCQYMRGKQIGERGLINHVVAPERVEAKALSIARRIADKPRNALRLLKRSLSLPRKQAFEEARTVESMMHEICFAAPETRARIAENYREIASQSDDSSEASNKRENTC